MRITIVILIFWFAVVVASALVEESIIVDAEIIPAITCISYNGEALCFES